MLQQAPVALWFLDMEEKLRITIIPPLKSRLSREVCWLIDKVTFQLLLTQIVAKDLGVTIELKPKTGGEKFKGFLIQARSVDGDDIIGTFEELSDKNHTKHLQCKEPQSALTHSDPTPKQSVKVKWTPPQDFAGKVKVLATMVKDFNTYWVKLESDTFEVTN